MPSIRMSSRGSTPKRDPTCGRCASAGQKPDRPGANVLPDLHALTRFEPQLVSGLRRKHLVELVDVLDDLVTAELLGGVRVDRQRSEEHTSELQSRGHLVCRPLLDKKKQ